MATDWEVSFEEAAQLLAMVPNPSLHEDTLVVNDPDYGKIELAAQRVNPETGRMDPTLGDQFVSDKRGSLHLLYRQEDLGDDGLPKSKDNSSFEDVAHGDVVQVPTKELSKAGVKRPGIRQRPEGMDLDEWKEFLDAWAPPLLTYDKNLEPNKKGQIPLVRGDNGEVVYFDKKYLTPQVKSLMDPGMRKERLKADIMMTHGNAKATDVQEYIERFHDGSGEGPEGSRQMVLFAGEILTGCRTLEAKLRLMGFRDVNEVIEGSPLHDPTDPTTKQGVGPNGKYFVTYIGSTYTGDREQNTMIFKKTKDARGRDSDTSLFVHNLLNPSEPDSITVDAGKKTERKVAVDWKVYQGDNSADYLPEGVLSVGMSNLSPEQRITAKRTLGIDAPESYVMRMNGKSAEKAFFYGADLDSSTTELLRQKYDVRATKSQDLLSLINRSPDPTTMPDPAKAEEARKRITELKEIYSRVAADNATMDPPITAGQESVYNNCEIIVCSDAAQVGMNLGNASELGAYDSLGSPMAEWQRYTRCARMLPEAVPEELMGKPIMERLMAPERDENGEIVMEKDSTGKNVIVEVGVTQKNPETGKAEPVMVQKRDANGRFMYHRTGKASGIFDRLRSDEPDLFNVTDRKLPVGTVTGLQLPELQGAKTKLPRKMTVSGALQAVIEHGRVASDLAIAADGRQWDTIVAKAEMALSQGGIAAAAQLRAFKDMKAPGSSEALVEFPRGAIVAPNQDEGTYARSGDGSNILDTNEPEAAISKWFQALPETDKKTILDSGYNKATPPAVAALDAKDVYLSMRSQEILEWVDNNRSSVAESMRGQEDSAITDDEVTNRLIDMLTPADRAVLKTKKYLVNVRKFGAGGAVGQVVKHRFKEESTEGGRPKNVTELVHTGYENEALVSTDVRTRTMGRGRTVSNEQIMGDVQAGVEYKADTSFEQVTAAQLATAALKKSLALVFDLATIVKSKFSPLDMVKGGPFVGPRGGKWADSDHTIAWKEGKSPSRQRKHAHGGTGKGFHNDHKDTTVDEHRSLRHKHDQLSGQARRKMRAARHGSNEHYAHKYESQHHDAMANAHGYMANGKNSYGGLNEYDSHSVNQSLGHAREHQRNREDAVSNAERNKPPTHSGGTLYSMGTTASGKKMAFLSRENFRDHTHEWASADHEETANEHHARAEHKWSLSDQLQSEGKWEEAAKHNKAGRYHDQLNRVHLHAALSAQGAVMDLDPGDRGNLSQATHAQSVSTTGRMSDRKPSLSKGELTTEGRKRIAGKNFALPGRRYPIQDIDHARNALSRVAQHGTPEEVKAVRRAVNRAYPSLADDDNDMSKGITFVFGLPIDVD